MRHRLNLGEGAAKAIMYKYMLIRGTVEKIQTVQSIFGYFKILRQEEYIG